jgi:hypothetical protein
VAESSLSGQESHGVPHFPQSLLTSRTESTRASTTTGSVVMNVDLASVCFDKDGCTDRVEKIARARVSH